MNRIAVNGWLADLKDPSSYTRRSRSTCGERYPRRSQETSCRYRQGFSARHRFAHAVTSRRLHSRLWLSDRDIHRLSRTWGMPLAGPATRIRPPKVRGRAEQMVRKRSKWVIGTSIIAASLALSGVAVATGPTGSVVSEVIGAGSTDEAFKLRATADTNTVVASFTFGPNSSTGWHTHPGRTLVTVKSGTFTVYHAEDCDPLVYEQGDAFVELPSTVHVGRNETSQTVQLGVVFFRVPTDGSPRIDQPQPEDCDVT